MIAGTLAAAAALLFLASSPASAEGGAPGVPFSGYRGIALTFHAQPTAQDVDKIAAWGANLVRLVIHADPEVKNYDNFYAGDGHTFNEAAFARLDRLVELLGSRNIRVNLSLHDFPGSASGKIWLDFSYWRELERLWSTLASRYRDRSAVVAFEIMNEPQVAAGPAGALDRNLMRLGTWSFPAAWTNTPRDYLRLFESLGGVINRIAPDKTVIVPAVGMWGAPVNFSWMRPVRVNNVVYTFHMYLPHAFADSGKGGSTGEPYDRARSRDAILKAMEPVERFAKEWNARIYVGELGLSHATEGRGARDWMQDVLGYLEQQGWSWTYWTYSIDFRNPETIRGPGGTLVKRSDTERLTVLREYWARNGAASGTTPPDKVRQ
jgi:hypothetical protein